MLQRETHFGGNQAWASIGKERGSDLFLAQGNSFIWEDKQNYKYSKILPFFPSSRLEHWHYLFFFADVQLKISTMLKYRKVFFSL